MMLSVNEIIRVKPYLYLGGSTSLMLQGAIPEGKIGDLDFACLDYFFNQDIVRNEQDAKLGGTGLEYHMIQETDYTRYKIDEKDTDFYYDVFVRKDIHLTEVEYNNRVYLVQHKDQIIKYKKRWNREKDHNDLSLPDFTVDDIPF